MTEIIWTSTWQILSLLSATDGCAYQLHQIKLPNIGFIKNFVWIQERYQVIQREKKLITHVNGDLVWYIGTKIVIATNIVEFSPFPSFSLSWSLALSLNPKSIWCDAIRFGFARGKKKCHRQSMFVWHRWNQTNQIGCKLNE